MTGTRNTQCTGYFVQSTNAESFKKKIKKKPAFNHLLIFGGNFDCPFIQKVQMKLRFSLVKISDVKGCTKETQLQMRATNE